MAEPRTFYYRPYDSGSESDSDSDSSLSSDNTSIGPTNQPNYRQFASDLQLAKAGGPDFPDIRSQLIYEDLRLNEAPYDISNSPFPDIITTPDTVTSIIMLDSKDRDKSVYPQPTQVVLRLPRVYKNVTNFQLIQIKLLSSFFYFRADKGNLTITIQENGRIFQGSYGVTNTSGPLYAVTTSIVEGTYSIQTLVAELQRALNYTPLFYDYANGFTDFAPLFAAAGDYSLNFNQPGDTYYDAVNNIYINTPTMSQIVSHYFQTLFGELTSYSIDQIKVAYYYPVVKEVLLDKNFSQTLNLNIVTTDLLPTETVRSRCIYTFQGINDAVILQVISINVPVLDQYRLEHTFRFSLINEYSVSYNTNNNRVTISSSGLNTSLVALLNIKYNQFFIDQLAKYNLTMEQYNLINSQQQLLLATLTDMYYYLQKMFALYFGINFNSYSLEYFTQVYNQMPLANAYLNTGVSINYDSNVVIRNISPTSQNELSSFRSTATVNWPGLTSLPKPTVSTFFNLNSNANPSTTSDYSHPYNLVVDVADYLQPFIDVSGVVYQNPIYKSANIITNINPTEYTVFKFKSYTRQTLRATVLPRPTKYRYPAYNAITYDKNHQKIFDNSYSFVLNQQNAGMDVPGQSFTAIPSFPFGVSYADSLALWGNTSIPFDIQNNRLYFSITPPLPPAAVNGQVYTYTLNLAITNIPTTQPIPSPFQMFLYHDRGAFMADVFNTRNENALNYLQTTTTSSLTFTAYANQTYYILLRTQSLTFTTTNIAFVPNFPNGQAYTTLSQSLIGFDPLANPASNLSNFNYAAVADSNFIQLPVKQQTSNNGYDSNYLPFGNAYVPMGYDSNGVSTDLTDYVGYVPKTLNNTQPNSVTRIDPITGYIFQVGSGYNSTTMTYISTGSSNQIITSNAKYLYTPTIPPTRESVIAHWYSDVFMPDTANQPYIPATAASIKYTTGQNGLPSTLISYPYVAGITYPKPFSKELVLGAPPDLSGYSFFPNELGLGPDLNNNTLTLGDGIVGISLIPDDGIWDVSKIMFRSAHITGDPTIDPNLSIKHLGVYPAAYLNTLTGEQVKLSNATMVFDLSSSVTYGSTQTINFGFDQVGGTFYEWTKSTKYKPLSNAYLNGYAQTQGSIIVDSNAFYSIVPFDMNSNITTFSLLSGSVVPYPYYSDASASLLYKNGVSSPLGSYVIDPVLKANPDVTRGPPKGYDQTMSQYEQSIPIGTSVLQYLQPPVLIADISGCKPFGPLSTPIYSEPCFRVPNYALFPFEGILNLYTYQNNVETREFSTVTTFTQDIFFTNLPNAQLVGISGNSNSFAFLGLGATLDSTGHYKYTFQIETYNVSTQTVSIKNIIKNEIYPFPTTNEIINVDSFNYNDYGGYTFTFEYGIWNPTLSMYENIHQVGMTNGGSNLPVLYLEPLPATLSGVQPRYEILQSVNEPFGRFYIAARTPFQGGDEPGNLKYRVRDFVADYNLQQQPSYFQNGIFFVNPIYFNDININGSVFDHMSNVGTPFVYNSSNSNLAATITRLNLFTSNDSNAFGDVTLVQNPYENKIFLSYDMIEMGNNAGVPKTTYAEVTGYLYNPVPFTSNAYVTVGKQIIRSTEGSNLCPYKIVGGGGGSFWCLFNENNRYIPLPLNYITIWGNRGDSTDFHISICNAYQIFYPTQRIVMKKVAREYNPITDLSGLEYAEYPHTSMFAYNSTESYISDISANKWGLESNFLVSDTQYSGYYFNACALDVPLFNQSDFYYIAVRAYSPSEKSQVMVRFSLPNRYDFGYVRLIDLSNEILLSQREPQLFNSNYTNVINLFNNNFIFDSNGHVFGSNIIQGYAGSNYSNVVGFGDFLNRFISLYNQYETNVATLSNILAGTNSNLQQFIKHDLGNIIPSSATNRQRYTDPIIYSILWKSSLVNSYVTAEDNWGLGWNLGYDKVDTPYDTTHVAQSFYKILDDYINLRMNTEFDMNQIATGDKENLKQSQEPTGSVKAYFGKLLLNTFGSYAQTLISNPIIYQSPLPKVDRLSFTWLDTTGTVINNNDCEWNAVIQMVEQVTFVKPGSNIVYVPSI